MLMVQDLKEILRTIHKQEKDLEHMLTEIHTKAFGKTIFTMDKVFINQKVQYTKVNLS